MKSPTPNELAALEAAILLPGSRAIRGQKRPTKKKKPTTQEIWAGWTFEGDNLVDPGGNRYGQGEIQAIFFNRQTIRFLQSELKRLAPKPAEFEPVQLSLPFAPAYMAAPKHS